MRIGRAMVRAIALSALVGSGLTVAQEQPAACPEVEKENDYGSAHVVELGGSITGSWTSTHLTIGGSPSVGYFFADRLELSLLASFLYDSIEDSTGARVDSFILSLVVEPSYHLPVSKSVAVFAGLGAGVAFDAGAAFDLQPRIGLNLKVGRAGVITPELHVPILFSASGTNATVLFAIGLTTTL